MSNPSAPGDAGRVGSTHCKAVLVGGDVAVITPRNEGPASCSLTATDGQTAIGFLRPHDGLSPELRPVLPLRTHQSASWMLTLFPGYLMIVPNTTDDGLNTKK